MAISAYSTTASSNTTMEGVSTGESVMTIPSINDLFRGMGASLRSAFNDLQWFEYGDGDGAATVAYASATTFTVAGVDVTGAYHIGRKVRAVGSSTGTIYGFITNSAFSTNTTVTVAWISGSLSNEAITVSLSQLTATNDALPNTVAKTGSANTFTANQTIQSSDAGASEGPSLTLDRASASPAASDFIGSLNLSGRDSGAGTDVYAKIIAQIIDATAASEDARLILQAAVAGTLATILTLGPGVQVGAPTGGDPGAGKINATGYQIAGVAVADRIVQVVNATEAGVDTTTAVIPDDDTIPQIGEGKEIMTLAITPTNSSNKLLIEVTLVGRTANDNGVGVALFQDSTGNALAAVQQADFDSNVGAYPITFKHYMTAGTTSATTFRVRAGPLSSGTLTVNGNAGSRKFGGVMASSITITEIRA